MKTEKILLGGNPYIVEVAETEEQKQKGLQNRKKLDKDKGMLFIWDEPINALMWMHKVDIPLDIIYINEDQEVIDVKQGKPNDDTLLSVENTMYVVELNAGSGVKIGDDLEFEEDTKFVMKVLAPDGSALGWLEGGERIFSRKSTKVIIRKALKAQRSQNDKDFKSLGKYVFKEIKALDNRSPEYVVGPSKEE